MSPYNWEKHWINYRNEETTTSVAQQQGHGFYHNLYLLQKGFFSPLNDIKPSVKAYSTSIEERRDGHTAHQILQKQTLPSYKDGDKRSQRVVER